MMLTGLDIEEQSKTGAITISDFDPKRLGPNSYDLTLAGQLGVYSAGIHGELDSKKQLFLDYITVWDSGVTLVPGVLYLGSTNEVIGTSDLGPKFPAFCPVVEGKSGVGRLGMQVHISAGLLDLGFHGQVTLELSVVQPVKIYPNMLIAQVLFFELRGKRTSYSGNYQGQRGPVGSKLWKSFQH